LCVAEGIAQGLASYPVDFVSQDRLQFPGSPFHFDMKGGRTLVATHSCKLCLFGCIRREEMGNGVLRTSG